MMQGDTITMSDHIGLCVARSSCLLSRKSCNAKHYGVTGQG